MNDQPPPKRVSLRLASAGEMGVPLHHDAQIAALLATLRLRDDIPVQLYAAAASVLATIYDAAEE